VLRAIAVEFGQPAYSLTRLWQSFLSGWFLFDLFLCSAVSIGASAFESARRVREKELELATTRLRLLKAQLDPHFLFNTLNAISTLVRREPETADRMIENLAEFLRRLLDVAGRDEVSLERELEHLGLYVEIQKIRFRDRLFFEVDAAPETLRAAVPHMILQPLVENSIQHGKSPRRALRVTVRSGRSADGATLELSVEDDGVGFEAAVESAGGGVGLANTRARLHTLYGVGERLTLSARPGGGARVRLTLPWRQADVSIGSNPREEYELARTDRR
jgi:LytS/YehU family sensor histidine kinase